MAAWVRLAWWRKWNTSDFTGDVTSGLLPCTRAAARRRPRTRTARVGRAWTRSRIRSRVRSTRPRVRSTVRSRVTRSAVWRIRTATRSVSPTSPSGPRSRRVGWVRRVRSAIQNKLAIQHCLSKHIKIRFTDQHVFGRFNDQYVFG